MMARFFAVVAATFLIVALTLATLVPPDLMLGDFLQSIDGGWLDPTQSAILRSMPQWAWHWLVVPVMQRPAWLPFAALGLITAGLAMTFLSRHDTERERWPRS